MSEKMSAEELDDALRHVGNWCALGIDTQLANHIATLQREADGMREALEQISLFAGPTLPRYENAVNIIRDMQYVARAALNGSPQERASEGNKS